MNAPLPIDLTRRPSPETTLVQLALLAAALVLGGPIFVLASVWWGHLLHRAPARGEVLVAAVRGLVGMLVWAALWPVVGPAYTAVLTGRSVDLSDLATIWGLSALLVPIGGLLMAGSSELARWLRPPTLDEQLAAHAAYEQELLAKRSGHAAPIATAAGGSLSLGRVLKSDAFPAWVGVRQAGGRLHLDDRALSEHVLVIGSTGAGKTETLKRLIAEVLANSERDIYLVDGKGDARFAQEVRGLAHAHGRGPTPVVRLGQDEPGAAYDGFRGSGDDVYNRLAAMVGVAETEGRIDAHYGNVRRTLLGYLCGPPCGPPRSFAELDERLDLDWLKEAWRHDERAQRRLGRIKASALEGLDYALTPLFNSFSGWVGPGGVVLEEWRSVVFSLRTLSAGDTAGAFLKLLIEDLGDFAGKRQTRPALLVIDEFGAFGARNINRLLAQARSAQLGVVLATQSVAQLGDEDTRQELLDNTRTKLLMSTEQPDQLAALAGTVFRMESSFQHEDGQATGLGTTRPQHTYRVSPNEARALAQGEVFLMRRGKAAKLLIDPVTQIPAPPAEPMIRLTPPDRPVQEASPPMRPPARSRVAPHTVVPPRTMPLPEVPAEPPPEPPFHRDAPETPKPEAPVEDFILPDLPR